MEQEQQDQDELQDEDSLLDSSSSTSPLVEQGPAGAMAAVTSGGGGGDSFNSLHLLVDTALGNCEEPVPRVIDQNIVRNSSSNDNAQHLLGTIADQDMEEQPRVLLSL